MSRKATAIAPSNIAFIKYWGARDLERAIPCNPSISMTLDRCYSRCTVEALDREGADEILLRGPDGTLAPPADKFASGIRRHLDRLREHAGRGGALRVATENTFPSDAGIASSASGFAALTLAVTRVLELDADSRELSILARRSGSGSAARSVFGGYVEWPAGEADGESYAVQLAGYEHWDLRNVIAIVDDGPKPTSSRDGHVRATTSPHFARRLELIPERLASVREAIADRDLSRLGPVVEEDAIDLHLVAMSSRPGIFYWKPGTVAVLDHVRGLRRDGLSAWSTMDAGPNVHVICDPASEADVAAALEASPHVKRLIRDRAGAGPRFVDEHLG